MGISLTGLTPATTYDALIKVGDNGPIDGTLKTLSDGLGNDLPLQMSLTDATFIGNLNVSRTIALSAGNTSLKIENIDYTINNIGAQTGTLTGIYLNATETALNGQNHNLMDLQIAGVSKFRVRNDAQVNCGYIYSSGDIYAAGYFGTTNVPILTPSSGVINLLNNSYNSFSRLNLGLATSSFPAIKRNGTAIDFRLADDSGFATINANSIGIGTQVTIAQNTGSTSWNTTLGNVTGNVGTLAVFQLNMGSDTSTSSTSNYFNVTKTISPGAGSANFNNLICDYTINASGAQTGTVTGILLNATETNLNGITHNLMDLKVGGVSMLRVARLGQLSSIGYSIDAARFRFNNQNYNTNFGYIQGNSNGVFSLIDNTEVNFNRLQFGGTTSSFPSIKRNGTQIDFRLADDSGYASITAQEIGANVGFFAPNSTELRGTYLRARVSTFIGFADSTQGIVIDSSATTPSASAILQANSTTKGFLPPVMTDTQRAAIATPAEGLLLFNTTNKGVAYRDGTNWGYLSGAPQTVAASGGTVNVSFASGNIIDMTLTASTTLTLSAHVVGTYIFELIQGGSGSYTITWPASVKWSGGTAPTLTTTVGKTDIVTLFHDGTNFYGTYSLNY